MKTRLTAAVVFAAAALVGCQQQEFPGTGVTTVAMDSTVPAFFTARDSAIYIIERRVDLPIRPPTADEMTALAAMPAPMGLPSMPWVQRNDVTTEIQYTLSNLEDHDVTVAVTVNGYDEFWEFVPSATIVENEAIADYSNYEWTETLHAGERVTHTIRTEKIDTAAVRLACIGNGATNDNLVNFPDNAPEMDVRITPFLPAVIPGLVGFRIGLRAIGDPPATGATGGGAPKVVLEATVRAQSTVNKLLDTHDPNFAMMMWMPPAPTIMTPAPMMPAP